MFPQGGPGIALLLLRLSVAAIFFMGSGRLSSAHFLLAIVVLVSVSLAIGFLTPAMAVIACLTTVTNLFINPHSPNPLCVPAILDTVALALLGPGAYSLDARLFGRQVIVVPPRKDTHRQ